MPKRYLITRGMCALCALHAKGISPSNQGSLRREWASFALINRHQTLIERRSKAKICLGLSYGSVTAMLTRLTAVTDALDSKQLLPTGLIRLINALHMLIK